MTHPELAATFEAVANQGPKGFYTGRIAEGELASAETSSLAAIVELVRSGGGVLTLEDLAETTAEVIQPIKYDFRKDAKDDGITMWEVSVATSLV